MDTQQQMADMLARERDPKLHRPPRARRGPAQQGVDFLSLLERCADRFRHLCGRFSDLHRFRRPRAIRRCPARCIFWARRTLSSMAEPRGPRRWFPPTTASIRAMATRIRRLAGRYLDTLQRREGEWRIISRIMLTDYITNTGTSADWADGVMGHAVHRRALFGPGAWRLQRSVFREGVRRNPPPLGEVPSEARWRGPVAFNPPPTHLRWGHLPQMGEDQAGLSLSPPFQNSCPDAG